MKSDLNLRPLKIAAAVIGALFLILLVSSCIHNQSYAPYPNVVPTPVGPAVVSQAPVIQQPAVVAAPAPVIINQAPAHSGAGDAFFGSMAGTMLGNALSRPHPGYAGGGGDTTVHKTVTVNKTYIQQAPTTTAPAQAAPVQSPVTKPAFTPPPPRLVSAPAPRPTPTFSPRPSPSPSFSRPSFSAPRRR